MLAAPDFGRPIALEVWAFLREQCPCIPGARKVNEWSDGKMKAAAVAAEESCVAKLAQFFPEAIPVRIPVRVSRPALKAAAVTEATIIEFGTPQEVLFTSNLPLDFEDHVHLENSDGSLMIEAEVVAMQLHQGKTAIAARFLKSVSNWIIKK